MRFAHGRVWKCCFGCSKVLESATEFETHMHNEHNSRFAEAELPTLADMCEKHMLLDNDDSRCVLCRKSVSPASARYGHIAKHLEHVAVLSLHPSGQTSWEAAEDQSERSGSSAMLDDEVPTSSQVRRLAGSSSPPQRSLHSSNVIRDTTPSDNTVSIHTLAPRSSRKRRREQEPADLWGYVRSLEQRFSRMQDEYELRISRLHDEVISLKRQMLEAGIEQPSVMVEYDLGKEFLMKPKAGRQTPTQTGGFGDLTPSP